MREKRAFGTAVVLGVAVASLFACGRAAPLPQPQPQPPLLYFERPPADTWHEIRWDGSPAPDLPVHGIGGVTQSPDGSHVLWFHNDSWTIVDSSGHVASRPDLHGSQSLAWADDSSGLCVLSPATGAGGYQLRWITLSGTAQTLGHFSLPAQGTAGYVGEPNIAACSPIAGFASLTTAYSIHRQAKAIAFGELVQVNMRTGAISTPLAFPSGASSVVMSHDGRAVAYAIGSSTLVKDASSGQTLAEIPAVTPLGFSWDASLLGVRDARGGAELYQIATREQIWADAKAGRTAQGTLPEPYASALLFELTNGGMADLIAVEPDGHQRLVSSDVFPAVAQPCAGCSGA